MNGDKEKNQHQDVHTSSGPGTSSDSGTERRPGTVVIITPPPPSAPSEFLDAQWTVRPPALGSDGKTGPSLAPPPPSAPWEFLASQWMDGSTPERRPDDTDPAIFESAFVVGIQSAAQLERSDDEPDTAPKVVEKGEQEGVEVPPTRIRGVPLAAGEETARVFLPNEGLVDSVPQTGQVLILTNQRLIAFRGVEGYRDTHMAMTSEIAQCSVRTGQRNWSAIMQGLMVVVGGAFLYLIVGYWLAGRISGPNVPVLNIDVAPLVALVIVLAGVFILVSNFFTRPAGAVIFHGEGMEIAFPFRSSLDVREVYDLVDLAHSSRRRALSERE